MMRAINNEQAEGFPKQDEVKTVYVEHDLDSADTEQTVIDWTMKKLAAVGINTSKADPGLVVPMPTCPVVGKTF